MYGRTLLWFSGALNFGALALASTLYLGLSWRLWVVLALCIYLGLYMSRVFELKMLSSFKLSLISSSAGAALGMLIFRIFLLIWRESLTTMNLLRFYPLTVATVFILNIVLFLSYRLIVPVRRYLVIGREGEFDHLLNEMRRRAFGKLEFIGTVNPSSETLDSLIGRASGVLIADLDLAKKVEGKLREFGREGYHTEYICEMAEQVLGRIPIELVKRFGDHYEPFLRKAHDEKAKRVLDIVVSVIALLFFSPIMLLITVAILIETGRPVIFRQGRIGRDGTPFTIYKFRSLHVGPIDPNDPNSAIEKRTTFTGRIIRRLRLDEIPQFWNVLKGDMSVVGPRPEMEEYHRICESSIPFYRYRLNCKPGISGWAQLNYKHTSHLDDYQVKTEYDLYYVKNRNLIIDLSIILKTPGMMCVGAR